MSTRRKSADKRIKGFMRREQRVDKHQEKSSVNDYQPKILRKEENLVPPVADPEEKKVEVKKAEVPLMKHSATLISRNHLDTTALTKFIDFDNSNFYSIGVIGMKNSGKSTLLNLIASGKFHKCDGTGKSPAFTSGFTLGNGIEAFITTNRVILLDSAPILSNTSVREFVVSEADDIRQIQALFCLCHELLIVYESHQILNIIRMVICAKNMMKPYECDEPEITLVECRIRPGSARHPITDSAKSLLMNNNISDVINIIQIPDFDQVTQHDDGPLEIIDQLRDDINTRKELKTYEDPIDTEKTWWDKFMNLKMEGGHLLKEFESLREKYYQVPLASI